MQAAFAEKAGAAVVEKEFARASDKDKEWLELIDPKLRSRLLYVNPVCCLTTVDIGRGQRNAMVVSWLTPINNYGVFIMAINKQRHTASLILARRSFCLSAGTVGMESTLLKVGKTHGHHIDKFDQIEGLNAVKIDNTSFQKKSGKPSLPNAFNALLDSDSEEEGEKETEGHALLAEEAGILGCAAHMQCKVLSIVDSVEDVEGEGADEAESHHHIITARIERAFVSPDHWDGRNFVAKDTSIPACLSFLGSQRFARILPCGLS
jgi:flavin reductase (DIM6/NTAB) family NADH-FMN oxidoreductase RutF|eukprot:Stramenopile-MAST_4_protein_1912